MHTLNTCATHSETQDISVRTESHQGTFIFWFHAPDLKTVESDLGKPLLF